MSKVNQQAGLVARKVLVSTRPLRLGAALAAVAQRASDAQPRVLAIRPSIGGKEPT
ncbi:hypothetical protein [Bordetella avium]|uniref:hypothetical protein n=1 Tax=Bordetella avium TaxID=521 RepID=UPI0013E3E25E|nr:hypothetical protein [Bordetella avium]